MALMQMWGAKTILDFSSGWGDRAIGSMAGGAEFYCGVDPNPCVHAGYTQMKEFFGWGDRVQFICDTIEHAELPDREFDMVFTSPPYFDLELYDTGGDADAALLQSTNYGTERDWFDKFLAVAISKVWAKLKIGGTLAININQKNKNDKYIGWMIAYMKRLPNANYMGVISYANTRVSNPQPIWICRKSTFALTVPPITLRKFSVDDIPRMSEIMGNPKNMDTIATGETKTPEQTAVIINQFIDLEYTYYSMRLEGGGDADSGGDGGDTDSTSIIIGYIGYHNGKYTHPQFKDKNLTRIVIDVPYRGKGYSTSAYAGLLQIARAPLYAMIEPKNTASMPAR